MYQSWSLGPEGHGQGASLLLYFSGRCKKGGAQRKTEGGRGSLCLHHWRDAEHFLFVLFLLHTQLGVTPGNPRGTAMYGKSIKNPVGCVQGKCPTCSAITLAPIEYFLGDMKE